MSMRWRGVVLTLTSYCTCANMQRPLPADWASGCLVYGGDAEERAEWQVSHWSPCSADCGGGISTRDVAC
eukprot:scaffold140223_cov18-Tisochrysis_lutea.AAC.1